MQIFWFTLVASFLGGIFAALIADSYLVSRIAILGSFVGLERSVNEGIAWGIRIPGFLQPLLITIALILVGWYSLKYARSYLSQIAFGLVLGGGLANIVDRVRDGVVTDFFQVGSFPVFNVADSCITIGIGLLLWEVLASRQ